MFAVESEATTRALNGKMSSHLSIYLPAQRHVGEESAEEGPRRSEKREPRDCDGTRLSPAPSHDSAEEEK